MKKLTNLPFTILILFFFGCQTKVQNNPEILSLYPENPNYFLFQGKPTILLTSGEHYGSVMNTAFYYEKYLNTLKQEGFNYTRIFIGPYSEMGGNNFGISHNTMNPEPENWLVPWVKESASGKYDLSKWNEAFFVRLKAFVTAASAKGIVIEVSLFTSYYTNHQWGNSPFNPKNNIQGFDSISFKKVNTINNIQLMEIQEKYVRKVVQELNAFANIFFEIQNEPWADNGQLAEEIAETDTVSHPSPWQRIVETAKTESLEWQNRISQIVVEEESQLPNKHLIAQNISNFRNKIENPDANVSIFNFHYAYPEAASQNLALKKAIGLDETGFMPHTDFYYRSQAWKFLLSGGALYNNLDYSFTVGAEDGTFAIDAGTPGWGGVTYRKQLQTLKNFMEGFNYIRMKPNNSILKVTDGNVATFQVFTETGKQYAVYLEKASEAIIHLEIPDGKFQIEWINPVTGKTITSEIQTAHSGCLNLKCPEIEQDIALRIQRV
jgi:DNA-dependent RNA polymerase auxiliary subunit epsilon